MNREHKFIFVGLMSFALVVLLRNAWLGDDSFIILRTVDNFVNGYGLRWNTIERVQSFTSPLWTILLIPAYFITKDPLITMAVTIIGCSLIALWFSIPKKHNVAVAVFVFAVALSTPAFVFYGVSGLENPLIFLLLGLFFNEYLNEARLGRITLLFSLLVLTRHDLSLVGILPLLDTMAKRSEKGDWLKASPGFLPIIIWEIFSVIYYGALVPNTAFAKLPIDYSKSILLGKGLEYLLDAVNREPLTVIVILLGFGSGLLIRTKTHIMTALSIATYCTYVICVGGDFMVSRFFGPPFWTALILIANLFASFGHRVIYSLSLSAIALGFLAQHPVIPEDESACCGNYKTGGVADEKHVYYPGAGLLKWRTVKFWPGIDSKMPGRELSLAKNEVFVHGAVGFAGYFAGPSNYLIDIYALTDPFLSQLEPVYYEPRVGHYRREIPAGYYESVKTNSNKIAHPNLRKVYDDILLITRGELFSKDRFRAILDRIFGAYKPLIRRYSRDITPKVPAGSITKEKPNGTRWDAEDNFKIEMTGLRVYFKNLCRAKNLRISLDHNNTYLIRMIRDGLIAEDRIITPFMEISGLLERTIALSKPFNEIAIYNLSADRLSSVGHVITDSSCE
jgi:arabinofuranosyltransferase